MTLKQLVIHTMMLLDEQREEADIQDFTNAGDGVDVKSFINDAYAIVCPEDMPSPLESDDDVPELPEFAHAMLCDYAAAQVLRAQGYGGDENYKAHMDVFSLKRARLKLPPANMGVHIRNKYER